MGFRDFGLGWVCVVASRRVTLAGILGSEIAVG